MSLMKTAITVNGIKAVLSSFRIIETIYVSFSLHIKSFKAHSNAEPHLRIKSMETRDAFGSILFFS